MSTKQDSPTKAKKTRASKESGAKEVEPIKAEQDGAMIEVQARMETFEQRFYLVEENLRVLNEQQQVRNDELVQSFQSVGDRFDKLTLDAVDQARRADRLEALVLDGFDKLTQSIADNKVPVTENSTKEGESKPSSSTQQFDPDLFTAGVAAPSRKADDGRRKSMAVKMAEDSVQRAKLYNTTQLVRTTPEPKFFLNSLSAKHILNFLREWIAYQDIERTVISPAKRVSERVRNRMKETNGLTEHEFQDLEPNVFTELIAKEIVTVGKKDYFEQLSEATEDIKSISFVGVTPKAHVYYWDKYLLVSERMLKAADFFRVNNPDHYPGLKGPYGMLNWWKAKFDYDYYASVIAELKDEPKDSNYPTFARFVDAFTRVVRDHYDRGTEVSRRIPYQMNGVKSSKHDSSDRSAEPAGGYLRRPQNTNGGKIYSKPRMTEQEYEKYKKNKVNSLMALLDDDFSVRGPDEEAFGEDEGDPDESREISAYSNKDSICSTDYIDGLRAANSDWKDVASDDEEHELMPRDKGEWIDEYPNWDTKHISARSLNALDVKATAAKFDQQDRFQGCIYYTIFGTCNRGRECRHADGHNADGAKKTATWITRRIAETDRFNSSAPKKLHGRSDN